MTSLLRRLVILRRSYSGFFAWSVVSRLVCFLFTSRVSMRFAFGWRLRFLAFGEFVVGMWSGRGSVVAGRRLVGVGRGLVGVDRWE